MPRLVRLPKEYWDVIDAEAASCFRSGEKQLQALLSRIFGFGNPEIEFDENGILKRHKRRQLAGKKKKSSSKRKTKR